MIYKKGRKIFKIVTVKHQQSTKTKGIPFLECINDRGEIIFFWGSKYNKVHIDIIKQKSVPFSITCDCFIDPIGPADYWVHETKHQILFEEVFEKEEFPIKRRKLETSLNIAEGQQGVSYDLLFKPYLIGARLIKIIDHYIRLPHQIRNFIDFCQCVISLVPSHDTIKLELITFTDSKEQEFVNCVRFDILKEKLVRDRIYFTYKFDKSGHDRWIETDTGWRIDLSRGLDFFQKPEDIIFISFPQVKRLCKATTITYRRISTAPSQLDHNF